MSLGDDSSVFIDFILEDVKLGDDVEEVDDRIGLKKPDVLVGILVELIS